MAAVARIKIAAAIVLLLVVAPESFAASTVAPAKGAASPAASPSFSSAAAATDAPEDDVPSLDTHHGKAPIKLGIDSSSFNLGASESMLAWEQWHHLVGKALHKRVKKVTNTSMGEVVLDIKVTKDAKLTAKIISCTNQKMGDICLAATQAMDGDTVLIFPQESKRQAVHFTFDYKRGLFFIPKNHYITNDYERVGEDANNNAPP